MSSFLIKRQDDDCRPLTLRNIRALYLSTSQLSENPSGPFSVFPRPSLFSPPPNGRAIPPPRTRRGNHRWGWWRREESSLLFSRLRRLGPQKSPPSLFHRQTPFSHRISVVVRHRPAVVQPARSSVGPRPERRAQMDFPGFSRRDFGRLYLVPQRPIPLVG